MQPIAGVVLTVELDVDYTITVRDTALPPRRTWRLHWRKGPQRALRGWTAAHAPCTTYRRCISCYVTDPPWSYPTLMQEAQCIKQRVRWFWKQPILVLQSRGWLNCQKSWWWTTAVIHSVVENTMTHRCTLQQREDILLLLTSWSPNTTVTHSVKMKMVILHSM